MKIIGLIIILASPIWALTQLTRIEFKADYIYRDSKPTTETKNERITYKKFDKKGNIIEEGGFGEIKKYNKVVVNDSSISILLEDGKTYKYPETKKFNKFDETNRLIEEESWLYKANLRSLLINKIVYKYKFEGQLSKETEYISYERVIRTKTYQTQNGFIAAVDTTYESTLNGISKVSFIKRDTTYLDKLNRPKEIRHFYNDQFLFRQVYTYDKYGNLETEFRYNLNPDSLYGIAQYRFNKHKKIVSTIWKVIENGSERKAIYQYDKKMRLDRTLNYVGKYLTGFTKYEYM